jgi:hypothetical protein
MNWLEIILNFILFLGVFLLIISTIVWFVLRAVLSQEVATVVVGFVGRRFIAQAVSRLPDESRNLCAEEWLAEFEHNLASRPLKALRYAAGLHRVAPSMASKRAANPLSRGMAFVMLLLFGSLTAVTFAFLMMLGAKASIALYGSVGFVIASIFVSSLLNGGVAKKRE